MSFLISLLILLIIVGSVLYIVQMLPIDATIKRIIHIVFVVVVLIYLLQLLGGGGLLPIRVR